MTFLRTNRAEELPELMGMREQSEAWLAARGSDQFQNERLAERARRQIGELASQERFCVLTNNGTDILAVGALLGPDMDFWTANDDLHAAWYVGRLMVAEHGRRYGEQLLDLISLAAHQDGRKWIRLDCWRSNLELQDYYLRLGFEPVRVVEHPDRLSGALFQRATTADIPAPWDRIRD